MYILEDYLDRDDLNEAAMAMIDDFYWGYYYIDEYAYASTGSDEMEDATDMLNDYFADAFDKYDKLIGDNGASDGDSFDEPAEAVDDTMDDEAVDDVMD